MGFNSAFKGLINLYCRVKSKVKLCWNIIRAIVTFVCEIWVLKQTVKNKLMVFERKVLRRIFGPTKERDSTVHGESTQTMN